MPSHVQSASGNVAVSFPDSLLPRTSLQNLPSDATIILSENDPENPKESLVALMDRVSDLETILYGKTTHAVPNISSKHDVGGPPQLSPLLSPILSPLGNPSPLGLFGFAIVSWLAGVLKIASDPPGRYDGIFAGVGIFVGGVAQVLAGIFQYLKNDAHSATTFCLFGLHWVSQGVITGVRSLEETTFITSETRPVSNLTYHILLTVATIILWLPTFRMNRVLSTTLFTVIFVFMLDAVSAYGSRGAEVASGVFSCIAATLALYLALLDLLNEAWQKPVLPLFPHHEHKKDYEGPATAAYVPKRAYHKSAVSSVHL